MSCGGKGGEGAGGKGNGKCCARLDAVSTKAVERGCYARFRYASGGQGAIKRWPLASPRFRGRCPLNPRRILRGVPSTAASLRRCAPSGDLPPGTPMRAVLPLARPSEGAFISGHHAQHSSPDSYPRPRRLRAICPEECDVRESLVTLETGCVVPVLSVSLWCTRDAGVSVAARLPAVVSGCGRNRAEVGVRLQGRVGGRK